LSNIIYLASIWVIPIIVAITFHQAAHGFVARLFGDETAWRLGRVSFNPLKHIDPVGTILLPGLLLLHSPFLFGYAKPVPVNFKALRNPRRDMIWVAAAGPAINIALAIFRRARLSPHRLPARNRSAMGRGESQERSDHQRCARRVQLVSASAA
jgi:Zn-dependent protease